MPNSIRGRDQFGNLDFDACGSSLRSMNVFPEAFPSIHSVSIGDRISRPEDLVQALALAEGSESEINHTTHLMNLLERNHPPHCPSSSYGTQSSAASIIANSTYLKPLQSLLQEFVDVGGIVNDECVDQLFRGSGIGASRLSSELKAKLCNNELLLVEKHELVMKIAKLIDLLDEVEGRYEKYYHELEEAVSSFEMITGVGAAKCYTDLALMAMSRHFCSLRDAIMSHIHMEKRKLSQDSPKINNIGLSQLSLSDRDIRPSTRMTKSLRQLWRPMRGLPENSVAILRSWLFQHFLHPYPNDSEKLMLASQAGLTKNQVSNWFINARVRLWKPMIEEMYREEFGDSSSADSNPPANEY
ncbi:BEL1-like homeodomain protein 11 [Senna tora]|uniref:BEL1-like homeodomain protein 11 n=1 Tax=Senna tora TaxID=362788 RepID=A0A834T9K5_9FABA|nr:BEL1-like homeodomain protein 11 [Senna tora]